MHSDELRKDTEPSTQELEREQAERELDEKRRLAEADQPSEARQHERRSEKAAYLKEKLAERNRAERDQ